jgi:hypothetical protein
MLHRTIRALPTSINPRPGAFPLVGMLDHLGSPIWQSGIVAVSNGRIGKSGYVEGYVPPAPIAPLRSPDFVSSPRKRLAAEW